MIMQKKCEGVNLEMKDTDWELVLDRTNGYTGSDLINVTTYALQEPLGEVESNQTWIFTNGRGYIIDQLSHNLQILLINIINFNPRWKMDAMLFKHVWLFYCSTISSSSR